MPARRADETPGDELADLGLDRPADPAPAPPDEPEARVPISTPLTEPEASPAPGHGVPAGTYPKGPNVFGSRPA